MRKPREELMERSARWAWRIPVAMSAHSLRITVGMVKMSDIAAHVGVSRLTVSAVLNNRLQEVGISEETARRVRDAAVKLGYHRNHLALAMKTGHNPVIGCLISDLKAEWTSRTISGLLAELRESGYLIKIEEVSGIAAETTALEHFLQQRVAGIFCCNFNPEASFARTLEDSTKRYGTPIVCSISRQDIAAFQINSDDALGINLAVDHLWDLGHRRVAFIGGNEVGGVRMSSFGAAMRDRDASLPEGWMVLTDWNGPRAEEAIHHVLSARRRPSALLCASDRLAAMAIRCARHLGISVASELSVVGYSNSAICALMDPPLTSVEQPFEEIGRCCGSKLIELIKNPSRKPSRAPRLQLVRTNLVVRNSTAPFRGSK